MTMYGSSTPIRQNVFALRFESSTAAMARATTICGTAESRKIVRVLRSAIQNWRCWKTQTKLSKPTKVPVCRIGSNFSRAM